MLAETERFTLYAEACLDAYASAFGFDAAEALHQAVLEAAEHSDFQLPEASIQQSLF